MNQGIYFLFLEKIPVERLEWIKGCISRREVLNKVEKKKKAEGTKLDEYKFFLSGDALFSLVDNRYQQSWKELFSIPYVECILDSEELNLLGLDCEKIVEQFPKNQINFAKNNIEKPKNEKSHDFWDNLINSIHAKKFNRRLGFLAFQGPYMSRTSVKMLRLLERSIKKRLNPQLFTYLDGIHLGHLEQQPSEFENIGKGLLSLKKKARKHGLNFTMLSCSRCGTARGYIRNNQDKEYKVSEDVISGYSFCNLNKIIDFYEKNGLILAPNWGSVQFFSNDIPKPCKEGNLSIKNPITIFITHSPYGSEWTFGGLSFAMACANHGIHTNVVFIEDGIYCIHGNHKVNEKDKIFNIQEIIIATYDMEDLNYFVFKPSLDERHLSVSKIFDNIIKSLDSNNLDRFLFSQKYPKVSHNRILFF